MYLLTFANIPCSLQIFPNTSIIFLPECGPDSLRKSTSVSFSSHSLLIQCAVMPRNEIKFGDVHVSNVKDICPGIS
jgi:hypothetical protein